MSGLYARDVREFVAPPKAAAMAAAAPLAAWRNRPVILDASKWQNALDWKAAKADGVVGAIIRGGQGDYEIDRMLDAHLEATREAGLPTGVYWVVDPFIYMVYPLKPEEWLKGASDRTVAVMRRALKDKAFTFLAVDLEMFKTNTGEEMSEAWVVGAYRHVYEQVRAAFPNLPVLVYTAKWVADKYPSLAVWLEQVPELWLAQYPVHPAHVVHLRSIGGWRRQYAPPDEWQPRMFGKLQAKAVRLWQVSGDRFTFPWHRSTNGLSAADINVWSGSVESWYEFAGWKGQGETPTPPPAPPPAQPPAQPPGEDGNQLDRMEARLEEIFELALQVRRHFS